jgi:TPP-dependent pyruvate/acetoin dehydrogenase alpha subunit
MPDSDEEMDVQRAVYEAYSEFRDVAELNMSVATDDAVKNLEDALDALSYLPPERQANAVRRVEPELRAMAENAAALPEPGFREIADRVAELLERLPQID